MEEIERVMRKLDKILDWQDGFKIDYATEKEKNRAHREDKRMHNSNGNSNNVNNGSSFWNPKLIVSILLAFGAIGTLIGKAMGWI